MTTGMQRLWALPRLLFALVRRVDPVLWGIMALGLTLRLLFLGHDSLWLDEINSLIVAATRGYPTQLPEGPQTAQWFFQRHLAWQPLDIGALIAMLSRNVHAPLYYVLLNPWLGLFGLSEASLRGFSVLFSTALIVPVYALVLALAPEESARRAARWAALLTAVSPFHLAFAQEGRMYALALFLSALAALALWKALYTARITPWAWTFALASMAGCLTHYSFWFQLPFYGLFSLWALMANPADPHRRARLNALAGAAVGILLVLALWSPVLMAQRAGVGGEGGHFSLGLVSPWRMLGMLGWEPLTVMGGETLPGRIVYGVLLIAALGLLLAHAWRQGARVSREGFLAMGLVLPLGAQAVADVLGGTHTITIVRYAMLIAPIVLAMAACGLGGISLRRVWARGLAGGLVLGLMACGVMAVWPGLPMRYKEKYPARAIMAQLSRKMLPGDLLAVNGPLATPCEAAYYLMATRPHTPVWYWARGGLFAADTPVPDAAQWGRWPRVWLFFYRSRQATGAYLQRDALRQAFAHEVAGVGYRRKLTLYHTPLRAATSSAYKSQ